MEQVMHAFSGSNTAEGFFGFFGQLQEAAERTVILKGGPGVGKSTLMKKVGAYYEEKGLHVCYFHCSGDPDSVDAVQVKEKGYLMVDGTSPHRLDPLRPGAKDSIVNLGVCLAEGKLAEQQQEIDGLFTAIGDTFARAYRYLKAAAAMRSDSGAVYARALDGDRQRRVLNELLSLLPSGVRGEEQHAFLQAITWKGVVQYPKWLEAKQMISLNLPWGMDCDVFLQPILSLARQRRLPLLCWHDPLEGKKLSHVQVGDVLFTTAAPQGARVLSLYPEGDRLHQQTSRLSFNRAVYDLCLHQAVDVLAEAKADHDRLERYYIDAMDFGRLQAITREVLEELP